MVRTCAGSLVGRMSSLLPVARNDMYSRVRAGQNLEGTRHLGWRRNGEAPCYAELVD